MLGTQQAGWTVTLARGRALGKIPPAPQSGGGMQKGSLPSGHSHIRQFCKTLYSGPTLPSEKNIHVTSKAFAGWRGDREWQQPTESLSQVTKHFLLHHPTWTPTAVGSWFCRFGLRKPRPGGEGTLWQSQPWPVRNTLGRGVGGQESSQHCSLTVGSVRFTTLTSQDESQSISAELRPHWFFHVQAMFQVLHVVECHWPTWQALSRSHRGNHRAAGFQIPTLGSRWEWETAWATLFLRTFEKLYRTQPSMGRHQEVLRRCEREEDFEERTTREVCYPHHSFSSRASGRRLRIPMAFCPGATAGKRESVELAGFQWYCQLFPWGHVVSSGFIWKWDIWEALEK